jgi:hypothetical protein
VVWGYVPAQSEFSHTEASLQSGPSMLCDAEGAAEGRARQRQAAQGSARHRFQLCDMTAVIPAVLVKLGDPMVTVDRLSNCIGELL